MNNGGTLEDLQKILGHKDRKTTEIYGKIILPRLYLKTKILQATSKIHQLQPVQPSEQSMPIAV